MYTAPLSGCLASLLYAGTDPDKRRPISIICYDKPRHSTLFTGSKKRQFMRHIARTVRKHAIDKPRQAGCKVCHHLLRSADSFAAHHTGGSFSRGAWGCLVAPEYHPWAALMCAHTQIAGRTSNERRALLKHLLVSDFFDFRFFGFHFEYGLITDEACSRRLKSTGTKFEVSHFMIFS